MEHGCWRGILAAVPALPFGQPVYWQYFDKFGVRNYVATMFT
jgi:hypothetical protein